MFSFVNLRFKLATSVQRIHRHETYFEMTCLLTCNHHFQGEDQRRHFSEQSLQIRNLQNSVSALPSYHCRFSRSSELLLLASKSLSHQPSTCILSAFRGYHGFRTGIFHTSVDLHELVPNTNCVDFMQVRQKSKKRKDNSSDSESDDDGDDNLDEDDFDAPANFKINKIHVTSLRTDAVLSHALGVARNRLEEMFFGRGLLMNGKKMMKKGEKMDEGDYVDLVIEKTEDKLKVKRVKVLNISSQKTSTDKLVVKVRVWKAPFLIDDITSGVKGEKK